MLKREIGRWDLVLLMINTIIGAGIFGLPSKIFGYSGFYSLLALLVCAAIVFVIVFNFAEVSSRFDKTGGPYLYTLAAFGRTPGFIIGWLTLITRLSAYAALINLVVTYLSFFNHLFLDQKYRFATIILITLLLTLINYHGVKNSTLLNNIFSIAKLVPLLIFIIVGFFFLDPHLIDVHQTLPTLTDFSNTVLILIFAFTGFEAVIVNTGEVQNPVKNIPFALITAILFIAVFYLFIQIVSIGTLPQLASSDKPITDAAELFMGPFGGFLITLGAVISIVGSLNAVMLIGSRVPFALSEENQFPGLFLKLHPKYGTPVISLMTFSGVALIASLTGSFIYAVSISVICKVSVYLIVCAALIKLRRQDKPESTYYKIPYGYFFATLGIVASLWLLSSTKSSNFVTVLITTLIGLVLYGILKITRTGKSGETRPNDTITIHAEPEQD